MKRRTKRKIRKYFQKHSTVLFVMPLIVSIFCLGVAYSELRHQLAIDGNAKVVSSSTPGSTCKLDLTFQEMTSWSDSVLQFKVTFTNNSDEDMKSITLRFLKNGNYSFGWATGISSTQDDNYYYLEFEPWIYASQLGNEEDGSQRLSLHPGESLNIEFGFNISAPMTMDDIRKLGVITNCGQYNDSEYTEVKNGNAMLKLSPAEVQIAANIEFESLESYSNRVTYKVTLSNNHDFDITDWRLNVYYGKDYTYDSAWPSFFNIIDNREALYNVELDSLNTLISAGETVEFHIVLKANNPIFETDESGNQVLVIPDDYMPDIIAAGIQKGTVTNRLNKQ